MIYKTVLSQFLYFFTKNYKTLSIANCFSQNRTEFLFLWVLKVLFFFVKRNKNWVKYDGIVFVKIKQNFLIVLESRPTQPSKNFCQWIEKKKFFPFNASEATILQTFSHLEFVNGFVLALVEIFLIQFFFFSFAGKYNKLDF